MNESVRPDLGPARDFFGYGPHPPHPHWPGDARIAINFNLNFEAGGERSLLEGDNQTEDMLNDIGFPAYFGVRSPIVETVFEYGPRVGVWRLLRIFKEFDVKVSVLGVVRARCSNARKRCSFPCCGHEIVSHGWRWIDYHNTPEAEEREHVRLAIEGIRAMTGSRPIGWFNGRPSANTRRLLVEAGGVLLRSRRAQRRAALLGERVRQAAPRHPLFVRDQRQPFDRNTGFGSADDFARYMIDTSI